MNAQSELLRSFGNKQRALSHDCPTQQAAIAFIDMSVYNP